MNKLNKYRKERNIGICKMAALTDLRTGSIDAYEKAEAPSIKAIRIYTKILNLTDKEILDIVKEDVL